MRKQKTASNGAVLRKRGSGSLDKLCGTASFVARIKFSGSPACGKPLGRCTQAGRQRSGKGNQPDKKEKPDSVWTMK
jgi:hypothetical protein